jgi:peptide deformylase
MAIREILLLPDARLKQVSAPVGEVDEAVRALAHDLAETLDASPGVGLAAPQIGALVRMIIVDAGRHPRHPGQGRFLLLNPEVVAAEGEQLFREGCLSVPEYTANIRRAASVSVRGRRLDGEIVTIAAEGFEAVVFQHEIDHLDGILFLDRVAHRRDLFPRKR